MGLSPDGAHVTFSFSTVTGRRYQVLFKDELGAEEWSPLGGIHVGTDAPIIVNDDIGPSPQRFYQVLLLP